MLNLATYDVNLFGLKFSFDSVAFELPIGGGWKVYWYGICIALAFLVAVVYGFVRAKKFGIDPDRLTDVVLVTAPLAILCARIYYIIFYPGEIEINSIGDFLGISSGSGMAGLGILGAVIGAGVFGFLMCKLRKINVLDAFDLAAICFLPAQAIGRWGNFFNQEAFGSLTGSSWWGMSSQSTIRELGEGLVHPCFLYESVWCIIGFVLLHILSKHRKFKGQLTLSYLIWYGFGRMFIEGLRTDSLYIGPLKVSQWLSAAMVIVGTVVMVVVLLKLRNEKEALTYETMFDDIEDTSIKTMSSEDINEEELYEETFGESEEIGIVEQGKTPEAEENEKEEE